MAFSPDGAWIASASDDGTILIWDGVPGKLSPGRWDDRLTALCPWHGGRFEVIDDMLGTEIDCPECNTPLRIRETVCDHSDRG